MRRPVRLSDLREEDRALVRRVAAAGEAGLNIDAVPTFIGGRLAECITLDWGADGEPAAFLTPLGRELIEQPQ